MSYRTYEEQVIIGLEKIEKAVLRSKPRMLDNYALAIVQSIGEKNASLLQPEGTSIYSTNLEDIHRRYAKEVYDLAEALKNEAEKR